jgi:dTDP-4-dehydrorhamnose reductase
MDVLVLGAAGLLGSNVVADVREREQTATGTYHSTRPPFDVPLTQLDIRDRETFRTVLDEHDPDAVVNCAAMAGVDYCEEHPDEAFAVNGRAPGHLAAISSDHGASFAHVSTDYVFDGNADTPYDESSPANPIQVYGKSKIKGERTVHDAHDDAVVVRLSFVWGEHRSTASLTGFPAWLRDRLAAGKSTPLFTDQHVTPRRAGAAATTIVDLLDAGHSGTFHVASRSCVTPYEFGRRFRERLGGDETLLETGRQADVDRQASRPRYTCLDVGKVETTLDRPQPTLEADLDAVSSLL